MKAENTKIPTPEELQRDVAEFLKEKYGKNVIIPPEPNAVGSEPGVPNEGKKETLKINFDLKPTELENYLKKYVVGQDEALEILSTKICTHFNRMRYEKNHPEAVELVGNIKSNVLMIGPTGVGKTYLLKLIAKKIGVPFVKGDATKFSETGYVGGDVEDLVRNLVHEANGDISIAEYGIIYLDEIDKIASSGNGYGPDVSRGGVQRNLLKLMEEAEVDLKTPHDLAAQMEAAMEAQRTGKVTRKKINTRNILFVMSGAFFQLTDIIKRRLNQQPIGFQSDNLQLVNPADAVQVLKKVKTEDLIKFGFESEFIGRLPVVVTLNSLDVEGLYQILNSANSSVIQGKKRDFTAYGIDIQFEDSSLRKIAEMAYQEQTGARGLVSVIDRLMLRYEKILPDTEIQELHFTEKMIEKPHEELDKILTGYYIKKFQKRFLLTNGIVIVFTKEAIKLLKAMAQKNEITLEEECTNMLRDYEYGLRLLGCEEFTVDESIVREPKKRLEELIKKTYEKK